MGKYVVELSDVNGLSCRVRLSLPMFKNLTITENSTWKVLDEGFLKFRSGGCEMVGPASGRGFAQEGNLHFCLGQHFGVNLYKFIDSLAVVNDSGEGFIHQLWVANCEPGQITWAVIE